MTEVSSVAPGTDSLSAVGSGKGKASWKQASDNSPIVSESSVCVLEWQGLEGRCSFSVLSCLVLCCVCLVELEKLPEFWCLVLGGW